MNRSRPYSRFERAMHDMHGEAEITLKPVSSGYELAPVGRWEALALAIVFAVTGVGLALAAVAAALGFLFVLAVALFSAS